jgi:hypothetical protein
MRNFLLSLAVLLFLVSCAKKIVVGKYAYGNQGYFKIDKGNNYYYYSTKGEDVSMFSKGKILVKKDTINFIADSSFFFHIGISTFHFDSTLKEARKIILKGSNISSSSFLFSFKNGLMPIVYFGNNNTAIYTPFLPSYNNGWITLEAKLKDSLAILPLPLNDSIFSNTIHFTDVNRNDPKNRPWNVLELNVSISTRAFAFIKLPPYLLKKRKIIPICPIYELVK